MGAEEKVTEERQSLEEMFAQLEGVIAEMEKDGISLEHSFDLYNKGMGLLKECSKSIDEVEKKVLILDEDERRMNFKEEYQKRIESIESILEKYLPVQEGYQKIIMEAMEYSLMAGGKRLRPMLMKESFTLFGGEGEIIEPFMAAIEMIHTYSLVHDDLPAMDNDEYRRGRKTTHVVYGEDMGILAGDALLNYAFETACRAFDIAPEQSSCIGQALKILAGKAGIYGMIGGQVVDVKESGHILTGDMLDFIYRLKTSALIESSMMIGAVLAGADTGDTEKMEKIARRIGLAFQIQDDILDVTSTTEVLGKPVHSDEKNEKTTYVTWKGLEESKEEVSRMTEEAVRELRTMQADGGFLEELLKSLVYREK